MKIKNEKKIAVLKKIHSLFSDTFIQNTLIFFLRQKQGGQFVNFFDELKISPTFSAILLCRRNSHFFLFCKDSKKNNEINISICVVSKIYSIVDFELLSCIFNDFFSLEKERQIWFCSKNIII